jgi:hypothetical protein
MNHEIQKQFIEICKNNIENKLKWGESSQWSHNDFDELSVLIEKETGVVLSRNTLKRIWGKMKFDGSPSISTKNALARFAGYENWKDFVTDNSGFRKKKANKKNKFAITVLVVVIVLLAAFFGVKYLPVQLKNTKFIDTSKVHFSVREKIGEVPFSVIFDYDVSEINADSVWIRHSWNPKDLLDPKKHVRTILHFVPNYYCPKLVADDQVIGEACYHATTPGWLFLFPYATWEPRFYQRLDTTRGYMQMSLQGLKENNINIAKENHWVIYHLSKEFGVSGHHFELGAGLMNHIDSGGFTCQEAEIEVHCERGAVRVNFTHENCIKNAWYRVGDVYKRCIDHDLSALGMNMNQWNQVKMQIKDREFVVKKDNKILIRDTFNTQLGDVKALHFHFRGCGMVDYVYLMDEKKDTVYLNEFCGEQKLAQ